MLPLHSRILDELQKKKNPSVREFIRGRVYALYTLHNLFIDVVEPLI